MRGASTNPLSETLKALRGLRQTEDFDGPDGAAPLLVSLRDQLRSTLEESLAAASVVDSDPVLTTRLQGAVGGTPQPGCEDHLGTTPLVVVNQPKDHPGILLVTAEYPTLCGSTTSLYVFRADHGNWRLSWAQEPGNHPGKDPGQEGLESVLSDVMPDGTFYLAICHNPPWCTSCWSGLRIKIVRFKADGAFMDTVLHREAGFYRCDEENLPHLVLSKGGVTLRYQAMSSDMGLWGRQVKIFYAFKGNGVRAEPVPGLRPDETIDLWKNLDSQDAPNWSEPSAWASLKARHEAFRKMACGTYLFAQPGKEGSQRVLVAFEADPDEEHGEVKDVWYFTLTLRDGVYRVAAVSMERPEGFPGESPVREGVDNEAE